MDICYIMDDINRFNIACIRAYQYMYIDHIQYGIAIITQDNIILMRTKEFLCVRVVYSNPRRCVQVCVCVCDLRRVFMRRSIPEGSHVSEEYSRLVTEKCSLPTLPIAYIQHIYIAYIAYIYSIYIQHIYIAYIYMNSFQLHRRVKAEEQL